jgi:hypothetical protein
MSSWANCEGTGVSIARQRIEPAGNSAQDFVEAFEVHRLLEDVAHDLVDEGMVGNLDVADDGLEARCGLGEDAGEQIVGADALDLRRDAFALRHAQQLERAVGGPAPAGLEDGRRDGGLLEEFLRGVLCEEVKDVAEREAVLLGEGDVDAVVGGGGLQLEVEAAAEAFAQGESPGFVEAAAEGRMEDELHAAALIEEALGDDGGLGGDCAEDGATGDDVGDELAGSGGADAAVLGEEGGSGGYLLLGKGGRFAGRALYVPPIAARLMGHPGRCSEIGRAVYLPPICDAMDGAPRRLCCFAR